MKLSVIIVNYNVRYFLEQCLISVKEAGKDIPYEIIVVDNNSKDSSVQMIKEKFPDVTLIANKTNSGFSKANNQAIKISKGEYILLLNPDTIVEPDTFRLVTNFMDENPKAGALGVKMINGKGNFLPESKRGLPTPSVSFWKITGLSSLFPKSKVFGRYHLGYLDKNQINEVDILAGAFMLIRKTTLDKVGLLDEDFFMYGEDIDLSYRIIKAGYKNYYFPHTSIIHYKGESTKKSSINYVVIFYNAMVIFARKHFSAKNAYIFSLLINLAVYIRAFISILKRFFDKIYLPLLDFLSIYGGMYFLKTYWESNIKYLEGGKYPHEYITVVVPIYIIIWISCIFLSGGYDYPRKQNKTFRGIIWGTITILVVYALLSESFRYSRALILLGAVWAIISSSIIRLLLHFSKYRNFSIDSENNKRYIVVGEKEEAETVSNLLRHANNQPAFIGFVSPTNTDSKYNAFIGHLENLSELTDIYNIDEIVFCSKNISSSLIIDKMAELSNKQLEFKIAPPESLFIIGSNSISTGKDLYMIDINSIAKANNKRNKRILDFIISSVLLFLSPLYILFLKNKISYLHNIFNIFISKYSFIGYNSLSGTFNLPKIKPGILYPTDTIENYKINETVSDKLNLLYAKNYKAMNDLTIIIKAFFKLNRNVL